MTNVKKQIKFSHTYLYLDVFTVQLILLHKT